MIHTSITDRGIACSHTLVLSTCIKHFLSYFFLICYLLYLVHLVTDPEYGDKEEGLALTSDLCFIDMD